MTTVFLWHSYLEKYGHCFAPSFFLLLFAFFAFASWVCYVLIGEDDNNMCKICLTPLFLNGVANWSEKLDWPAPVPEQAWETLVCRISFSRIKRKKIVCSYRWETILFVLWEVVGSVPKLTTFVLRYSWVFHTRVANCIGYGFVSRPNSRCCLLPLNPYMVEGQRDCLLWYVSIWPQDHHLRPYCLTHQLCTCGWQRSEAVSFL